MKFQNIYAQYLCVRMLTMADKKKVLVLLAGCGAMDGAELREAVITLLALDKAGVDYYCAAPNIEQHHVLNYITNEEMNETRNVMVEAARIARGKILDLKDVSMQGYDALALPGGVGVAKNFCSFAFDGAKATANADVKRIINEAYDAKKPIAAICVSPALVALSLAEKNPNIVMTLGLDEEPNKALEEIGVKSKTCLSSEFIFDRDNLILSTPAYMDGRATLSQLEQGITKTIFALVELTMHAKAA